MARAAEGCAASGKERVAKSEVVQAFRPARRGGPKGPHYILQRVLRVDSLAGGRFAVYRMPIRDGDANFPVIWKIDSDFPQ